MASLLDQLAAGLDQRNPRAGHPQFPLDHAPLGEIKVLWLDDKGQELARMTVAESLKALSGPTAQATHCLEVVW